MGHSKILVHLNTELQVVEDQLSALYAKRDGLRLVLGAASSCRTTEKHLGPRLHYVNPNIGVHSPAELPLLRAVSGL